VSEALWTNNFYCEDFCAKTLNHGSKRSARLDICFRDSFVEEIRFWLGGRLLEVRRFYGEEAFSFYWPAKIFADV
jgi:hypothetical protein